MRGRYRRGDSGAVAAVGIVAAFLLAGLLAACTGSRSPPVRAVRVTTRPKSSVADQAVHIVVTGLNSGEPVTVQVSSTDARGVRWRSSATYRANATGDVDLDEAPATSGSYRGISGMGVIWSMRPERPDPAGAYFWDNQEPMAFNVTVTTGGRQVASASFERRFSPIPLAQSTESLRADGFVGDFWHPANTVTRRPAIVVLGGSGGGLPVLLPALLASNGYPALGVAYFAEPGLPQALSRIPLEYFAKALRWLARQPSVDPSRLAVLGASRGSEAAQLLGVYYSHLVHAVVASVPSNVALCSYPACSGPAWTFHGKAVPYTSEVGQTRPTDNPAAVIPDQRIQGPVFLACGEADQTWISCPYARAILHLLNAHHDRWTHVLYAYPGAGHAVGGLIPYEPDSAAVAASDPAYAADQKARALLWPHVLSFLADLAHSRSP